MKEYSGININVEALAQGVYEIIREEPESACLRFGMFPLGIMESFERNLKTKIPDTYYLKGEPLTEYDGKRIRREVEKDVCCHILHLAKADGFLVV